MNYRIILLLMLLSFSAKSQKTLLSKEIDFVKSQAISMGFELVQEDTLSTDFNMHLVIPSDILNKGNTYYWVLFTDKCSGCSVKMNYWNSNSLKFHPLDATISDNDSIQRLEYSFLKKNDIDINLEAFVEQHEKKLLYSILFKKERID